MQFLKNMKINNYPNIQPQDLEKYSSALTLSDMEIFIFPELLFSLVLANIMSPKLWAWRADPWFAGLHKLTPYRRILRLKQFIIDHYTFNLDLDTWGLTTQERELARFRGQLDETALAQSNALFGYEGDKYYFDLDIRKHFAHEVIQNRHMRLIRVSTKDQLADIFTKALPLPHFESCVEGLMRGAKAPKGP